ncbi:MAG: hypothetical protein ACYTGE_11220 [Planctomycetota bacterium]|jgi:hypothetical protein
MRHNPTRVPSPFQFNGSGSPYLRNFMAGQNRYTGTHSPSFGAYGCPGCGGRCGGFG